MDMKLKMCEIFDSFNTIQVLHSMQYKERYTVGTAPGTLLLHIYNNNIYIITHLQLLKHLILY